MTDFPTQHKFPEDSTNRDYDVFEEFPDGSTLWRACVFGMANVELKLRELAVETTNKFFALSLQDRSQAVIRPLKSSRRQEFRRAS
jgi:hypothetical protein